jgi:DNA-binding NtrC family response regulator
LRLLVLADTAVVATHALPESGRVTIGRAPDNAILLDDESISRHHAVLHVGRVITVEDVGSSNGTKLRDIAIPPHEPRALGVNELVTVGALTLIIQTRFATVQTSSVATHDDLVGRVEQECARDSRDDVQFAVIRIRVAGNAPEHAILDALTAMLRELDVIAELGDHHYELLLIDTSLSQAEHVAQRLVASLQLVGSVSHRLAHFPTDGRSACALMARLGGDRDDAPDLVIAEPAMRDLYALARRIAASDLPVLILGETGVGKEKMSRVIHDSSPRADKPFVAINCAAINDNLLESELFGHERGAFTGAHAVKAGLLESAGGGTVFLDEIGEMSLAVQAKLLRVIEDGEVRRVGSLKSRQLGIRFVAATNLDLERAVERGTFRMDLYFRLSAATLVVPPLRERPAEVVALARRFATHAGRSGTAPKDITSDALARLRDYPWPGNIRELRNVIERAAVLAGDGPIGVEHLPAEKIHRSATGTAVLSLASVPAKADERTRILDALARAGGNQGRAAALLGVSRRTLINRLVQYDLPRPRKGRA